MTARRERGKGAFPLALSMGMVAGLGLWAPAPVCADVVESYRNGEIGYSGTRAVDISSLNLSASGYGFNGTTFTDGGEWCIGVLPNALGYDISPLLRFEGLSAPTDHRLVSAMLELRVVYWGVPGQKVRLRYLAQPWATTVANDGTGVGWRTRDVGLPWTVPGALGEGSDVLAGIASVSPDLGQGTTTIAIPLDVPTVEQWISDPSRNHGVIVHTDLVDQHVGVEPPLAADVAARPRLVLVFVPGAGSSGAPDGGTGAGGGGATGGTDPDGGAGGGSGSPGRASNGGCSVTEGAASRHPWTVLVAAALGAFLRRPRKRSLRPSAGPRRANGSCRPRGSRPS